VINLKRQNECRDKNNTLFKECKNANNTNINTNTNNNNNKSCNRIVTNFETGKCPYIKIIQLD
jgi:hypothetical protein